MASTDCGQISDSAAPAETVEPRPDPAAKLRLRLFFSFAITVTIGLTLAGWYVGGRISAADQPPAVTPAAPVLEVAAPPPVVAELVQPPKNPELYLQVAALDPLKDVHYIRELEARGYHARVEPSADTEPASILIGPFPDRAELEQAQRKLAAKGILAMERP